MPLSNADTILTLARTYRSMWIGGRPGSYKTALAFRIAYEELKRKRTEYRYLISNVRSPWRDDPAKVVLRDGKYVDAICVIDEGGLFLKTGADAERLLAYMRKLNIMLIIPSFTPPTARLRSLEVQRTMNFQSIGVPALLYYATLNYGSIHEKMRFIWRSPSEIYGVYDTDAAASDDAGLDEWVQKWTQELKKATKTRSKFQGVNLPQLSGSIDLGTGENSGGSAAAELQAVADQRRAAELFAESADSLSHTLSVFGKQSRRKR